MCNIYKVLSDSSSSPENPYLSISHSPRGRLWDVTRMKKVSLREKVHSCISISYKSNEALDCSLQSCSLLLLKGTHIKSIFAFMTVNEYRLTHAQHSLFQKSQKKKRDAKSRGGKWFDKKLLHSLQFDLNTCTPIALYST